jgi:hypothetical protein
VNRGPISLTGSTPSDACAPADRCVRCDRPRHAHLEVLGVGRVCPVQVLTFKAPALPTDSGPFGSDVDPGDSERLRRLREIIDTEIGWASPEDEEAGDYEARLREVAEELKALRSRQNTLRMRLLRILTQFDTIVTGGPPTDFDRSARAAREAEERRG